jgi:alanine-glyoxylate transaminase/serine-glyoxylate transaminase/serine-pyruvate transaminase
MKELRLMIPGPVEISPEVLEEMSRPLVAHYGGEWTAFYNETLDLLRQAFGTRREIVLFPGSGSAGLDATFGSTLFPDGKVLIVQNGFFGERLEEIARTYTASVRTVKFPLGRPVELALIEEELKQGAFDLVAAVHCETSTGILNPIKEIGELCKQYDTLFMVDAVSSLAISSLAIEPLAMDKWRIDICVSASQKGLESPPGLGIVAVGAKGWERIEQVCSPGWYLNLKVWKEYGEKWGDWHPHPVTHAVNNVRALRVGLERILSEGLERRFARHRSVTERLRRELREIHLEPYIPDEIASHGVTAVLGPEGRIGELLLHLRDRHGLHLRDRHGLLLAGSLGPTKGKLFRIGHMGPGATNEAVETVISALKAEL